MKSIFGKTTAWFSAVGATKLAAAAVIAGACGVGGYYTVQWVTADDSLAATEQEYTVTRGDLSQTVSTSGTLEFANSAQLKFPLEGTLASLSIEEGQAVTAGEVLGSLDDSTVASLERAVAEAQMDLRVAEKEHEAASQPARGLELAEAQAAVANARLAVNDAEFALAEVEAGLNSTAVIAAQADLAAARSDYDAAVAELETLEDEWDTKVSNAESGAADAVNAYERAVASWFGPMDGVDLSVAPSVLLDRWDTTYAQIWDSNTAYLSAPANDDSTPWDEYTIWLWDRLYPDEVQPTCETTTDIPSGWRCIENELEDAWIARLTALQNSASVQTQSASALNAARVKVSTSESALAKAQQTVNNLINPATLDKRRAELDAANSKLVDADAALAEAREVDKVAVRLASAKLTQAQYALDTALSRRENAVLTAPFDGIVSSVGASEGDSVTSQTVVVEIVDASAMQIRASVDEIDVLSISRGDAVRVTMDALSGTVLEGTIGSIGSVATSNQGVVTFSVTITVTLPENLTLPAGLSATAEVVVQEVTDVLLVPSQAIGGSLVRPTVRVKTASGVEAVPVQLGASDDFWVVVNSGLNEGDVIIMTVTTGSSSTGFTIPGSGLGGGTIQVIPSQGEFRRFPSN